MFGLIIFFSFLANNLYSQNWDETRQNIVNNASQYRKHLMLRDTESLKKVELFIKKAYALEPDTEVREKLISNLHWAISCYGYKYKKVMKIGLKNVPNSEFMKQFSEEDFLTMKEHYELLDLITLGFLSEKYPYSLSTTTSLYDEIKYYNIQKTDTLAEIGAGKGDFSKILFFTGHNVPILINELNYSSYDYINKNIEQMNSIYGNVNMVAVKGKKKRVNLPYKVNKMIIRSTYHHFDKKEEMLSSIFEALTDDGVLFVEETPLIDIPKYCLMEMKEEEIINSIEANKFKLLDTLQLEYSKIFKFEKNIEN